MSAYRITFNTCEGGLRNVPLTRILHAESEDDARDDFERIFRDLYPEHLVTKCEAIR